MCEEFHCTPSEALKQDAATVFRILSLRAYADARRFILHPNTDEEAIERSGLPPWLVDEVMENIAELGRMKQRE